MFPYTYARPVVFDPPAEPVVPDQPCDIGSMPPFPPPYTDPFTVPPEIAIETDLYPSVDALPLS